VSEEWNPLGAAASAMALAMRYAGSRFSYFKPSAVSAAIVRPHAARFKGSRQWCGISMDRTAEYKPRP